MFCSQIKTFKFMAGPRSPTTSVTAQVILRRRRIILFWYCEDFRQRSNERMVVLTQTRSRAFHGVEEPFRLDGMKRFKNIRKYGWVVLPQTPPSSIHGVEDYICMDVLQPCKNIQVHGWAALQNIPCHGPAHFAALRNRFVLMLRRISTTFKWTLAVFPQTQSRAFYGVEEPFRLDGMKLFKKISINGWAVLPQTRPSSFHGVEKPFRLDVMQSIKHIQVHGWAALPNIPGHGSAHFAPLKNRCVLMFCRLWTTFKWTDCRAPPNTV